MAARAASPPAVAGVTAAQRVGTKLVDIGYTISDPDSIAEFRNHLDGLGHYVQW